MGRVKRNWKGTSLLMPANLLADLDAAAEAQGFASRADVIRIACSRFVNLQDAVQTMSAPQKEPTLCKS